MSSKAYWFAFEEIMTDEQRTEMCRLYYNGKNEDGHVWVRYCDVEEAVARILIFAKIESNDEKTRNTFSW